MQTRDGGEAYATYAGRALSAPRGRDGIRPASAIALAGHDRHCYVVLGPKEYLVLQILAQHAGKVVTRQEIMKQVWRGPHLDARVPGF